MVDITDIDMEILDILVANNKPTPLPSGKSASIDPKDIDLSVFDSLTQLTKEDDKQDIDSCLTIPENLPLDHPLRQVWEERKQVKKNLFYERDKFRPIHKAYWLKKGKIRTNETIEYGFEKRNIAWAKRRYGKNGKLTWVNLLSSEKRTENDILKELLMPFEKAHRNLLDVQDRLKKIHTDYISQKLDDENAKIVDIKYDWSEWNYSEWDYEYNSPSKNIYTYTVLIDKSTGSILSFTYDWSRKIKEDYISGRYNDEVITGLPVGTIVRLLNENTKKELVCKFVEKKSINTELIRANPGQSLLGIDDSLTQNLGDKKEGEFIYLPTPDGQISYKILEIKLPS